MGSGKTLWIHSAHSGRACWYAVANAPEGEHEDETIEKRKVIDLVSSCHKPVSEVVEATEAAAILRTDLYDRPSLSCWSQGRVTLLGDAAHPMLPNLGQGACQAIEDAFLLVDSLKRGLAITAALQDYEIRRIKRANAIVRRSRQLGWMDHWEHPWGVGLRDIVLRMMPSRILEKQMEWIMDNQMSSASPNRRHRLVV